MWGGRHCREGEGSKAEMVREARLRWYGYVIRRDEGELVRDNIWLEIKRIRGLVEHKRNG
jgi:hypothetical protein